MRGADALKVEVDAPVAECRMLPQRAMRPSHEPHFNHNCPSSRMTLALPSSSTSMAFEDTSPTLQPIRERGDFLAKPPGSASQNIPRALRGELSPLLRIDLCTLLISALRVRQRWFGKLALISLLTIPHVLLHSSSSTASCTDLEAHLTLPHQTAAQHASALQGRPWPPGPPNRARLHL